MSKRRDFEVLHPTEWVFVPVPQMPPLSFMFCYITGTTLISENMQIYKRYILDLVGWVEHGNSETETDFVLWNRYAGRGNVPKPLRDHYYDFIRMVQQRLYLLLIQGLNVESI